MEYFTLQFYSSPPILSYMSYQEKNTSTIYKWYTTKSLVSSLFNRKKHIDDYDYTIGWF